MSGCRRRPAAERRGGRGGEKCRPPSLVCIEPVIPATGGPGLMGHQHPSCVRKLGLGVGSPSSLDRREQSPLSSARARSRAGCGLLCAGAGLEGTGWQKQSPASGQCPTVPGGRAPSPRMCLSAGI